MMDLSDDSPRVGSIDVDREVLTAKGAPLALLLEQLDFRLETPTDPDTPGDGWRVLRRYTHGQILLGAPATLDGDNWRLASTLPETGNTIVQIDPEVARLRSSRAERRKDLELRWPPLAAADDDARNFVIDIVNTGTSRWIPDQDAFFVIGLLTEQGATSFDYGWVGSGTSPAVALDPQEYARVPVHVDSRTWSTLIPGNYDLHPLLGPLNLHGPALTITV